MLFWAQIYPPKIIVLRKKIQILHTTQQFILLWKKFGFTYQGLVCKVFLEQLSVLAQQKADDVEQYDWIHRLQPDNQTIKDNIYVKKKL